MSPRWLRLTTLGALYLAQGLPYGFFTLALPVLLRQRGLDLATVSASSLLALPWAAKWVWGPVIDRYGSRRAWILPLQLGSALLLGALALVDEDAGLAALAWGMLGVSLLASTQDVATDALAVQLLGERDRGLGNGLQVGAYRVGMVIGGGAVPAIYGALGPSWAFGALAVSLALTTLPALVVAEPPRERATGSLDPRRVLAPLTQRSEWPWLLVIATYKAGDHLAAPMARTLLVDRDWDLTELGVLVGLGGSGLAAVGALGGGALVPWLGRRRSLWVFGLLTALVELSFLFVDPAAALLAEHLVASAGTAALFTVMMDRCRRPGHQATDYALQAASYALAGGAVGAASGVLADLVGYQVHFVVCAAVTLLGAGVAAAVVREPEEA